MSLEIIQINVGVEQEVIVPYGNETLRLILQFDDYNVSWFLNLLNERTQNVIVNGINLKLGNDALFGLGLKYGSLTLMDADPTNPNPIDLKADFGDRLKLVRDLDA